MSMIIKTISDSKTWSEGLVAMGGGVNFMYEWGWGEFQTKSGSEVARFGFFEGEKCQAVIYGVEQKVPFLGKFVYFPRCSPQNLSTELFVYLEKNGYFFVRFESNGLAHLPSDWNIINTKNRQPQQTLVFSLVGDEDRLLARMHEKTRYNIRLSARKGVIVREKKDVDLFTRLNEMTTKRDGFKSHDRNYYEEMLAIPETKMFIAEFQGKPLAVIIGIVSGDTFTYLHGASSDEDRNLMAPYLVQWEAMRTLRLQGVKKYDFWGVSPQAIEGASNTVCFHNFCYASNHKWAGVTRFKAGFGGEYIEYPNALEIVLNKNKYQIFSLVNKLKKLL